MKPARKLLRKLIKEELSEYMIKGFDVKEFVDEALKKSGIKVTKYLPMKSGWLGGKFVWGAFYTVKANKRKDVLPFTVDKQGNLHLNVSPETYIVGKVGNMSKVVKTLKDFKKSDLDIFESVNTNKIKLTSVRKFVQQLNEDLDPYKDFATGNSWEREYDLNLGAFIDEYQKFMKAIKKLKPIKDENKRAWALSIRRKVGQARFNGFISMWMNPIEVLSDFKKFEKLKDEDVRQY